MGQDSLVLFGFNVSLHGAETFWVWLWALLLVCLSWSFFKVSEQLNGGVEILLPGIEMAHL